MGHWEVSMEGIVELKNAILNKNLDDSLFVFSCKDSNFIAHEYANAIAEAKGLSIMQLDDFDRTFSDRESNLFDFIEIDALRMFEYDEFDTKLGPSSLCTVKNAVVICKKAPPALEQTLREMGLWYEVPKLQPWQIEDYMFAMCPGLPMPKAKWLCEVAGHDVNRVHNEALKIRCFPKAMQEDAFDMIDSDNGYSDLTKERIFSLSNAISSRDPREVARVMRDIANIDVEPVGMITILKRAFMIAVTIQMDPTATAEGMGIKPAQFNIARARNCNRYTDNEMRRIMDFLVGFDMKLKSGGMDLSKERLIDYIICEVMS